MYSKPFEEYSEMKYFPIIFLVTKLNNALLCVNQYRTESGKLCQKWNQASPHRPKSHIVENVKKITGYTDHNQCVRAYSGSSRDRYKTPKCHQHLSPIVLIHYFYP